MIPIKQILIDYCHRWVDEKIASVQLVIRSAQASSNEETKSSVGDKYETARAMAQLEIEKNTVQLIEFQKQKQVLHQILPSHKSKQIVLGSVVITNKGNYFISISAGKIEADQEEYFCLSPASPLGAAMMGKHLGDKIHFNAKEFEIQQLK